MLIQLLFGQVQRHLVLYASLESTLTWSWLGEQVQSMPRRLYELCRQLMATCYRVMNRLGAALAGRVGDLAYY